MTLTKSGEDQTPSRPIIVCLCGSTRFLQTFQDANLQETLDGKIVLSIGCDTKTDADLGIEYSKPMLDELHLRKIDLADEVLILNVGGYVGESTARELEYALEHGKGVRFLEPYIVNDPPAESDRPIMTTTPDIEGMFPGIMYRVRIRNHEGEVVSDTPLRPQNPNVDYDPGTIWVEEATLPEVEIAARGVPVVEWAKFHGVHYDDDSMAIVLEDKNRTPLAVIRGNPDNIRDGLRWMRKRTRPKNYPRWPTDRGC